ncbi:unnamed protein product [Paramecium pentaurelia]|uniref:non-specific serine/threonine protein kinase n=1 Tax=Paramecium pentaurelia TaxID=43138 RepID=A0A8S1X3P9_9CILI|nr:unnamed protein product [Paramecium pentaurelia]
MIIYLVFIFITNVFSYFCACMLFKQFQVMNQQKFTIFTSNRLLYVLEEVLGKGSGGSVYRAYKVCNNQKQYVALKIQPYIENSELQTLEILSQQNLNHNINILDLDQYNNQAIIVMDLADGSFHDFWKKSKIDDIQEILCYFIQIVKGTSELHQLSLIHRDLKLENVVYQERNNQKHLKLCDTGLIRQQNGRKTISVGTPYYMSPEQINQSIYDEKIDIWALGMILYEMLAKQVMVKGNSIAEILRNILDLNQNNINTQIDRLYIDDQKYSNEIKNLLKMMIIRESSKRVNAEFVLTELSRILNIKPQEHNNNNYYKYNSILKPEIKEQLRLEFQREFEQKYQQEYEKLNEQHKLEIEQSKNDIIEYYQQELMKQKIQVQRETEENLKALQQRELNILKEEYNKNILNCNQQQIEQLKYQYEEEKQKIIKQMDQKYQLIFQQELKNKELDLQKEMDNQIQTELKNKEQMNKILLKEQFQKYYQEEFEKRSRNLTLFQNQLMSVQQNLNKSQMLINNQLKDLNYQSKLNQSQKFLKFIFDYEKQLKDKFNQIESIHQQLSQLILNSNSQQNQYNSVIDVNIKSLEQIKNSSQELICPNLIESFIQNSNQLLEEIKEEQNQLMIQHEKSFLKDQLVESEKEISQLQKLFQKQNEQIKEVYTIIDSLDQKDMDSIKQYEILNQQYNKFHMEFQIIVNSIKLIREEDLKVEILQKQNLQMSNLVDNVNKLQSNILYFKSKILDQKEREKQMISNQLQNLIETMDDWEQKIDHLNQSQQPYVSEELKEQFEQLNKEFEVLLEIKNRIIQLLNEIQMNQKQDFFKQFSEIQQQFVISIFKLELFEKNYQKEQINSQYKTKELIYVQEEQQKINSNLKQLFESIFKRINNLQNEFQNLSILCNNQIMYQHLSKQLSLIINIFDNYQKIAQDINKSIIDFQKTNFKTINEIKLEESKITIQINLLSQNLDPIFNSLIEIKKQIAEPNDIEWDNDLKYLLNQFEDLKLELFDIKLNERDEQIYNTLYDSKQEVQNNINNSLNQCENQIKQNIDLITQFYSIQQINIQQLNEIKKQQQTSLNKKKEIYITWIEEQKQRMLEIQNQVEKQENQKREQFIIKFIKEYKEVSSFIENQNLKNQISEIGQSKNQSKLNEYYQLAQQYRKKIEELKFKKQQNQSYFQTHNFYTQQNQMLNCLEALFQLYCLTGREKINLEQQKTNKNGQGWGKRQQIKETELQNSIESLNKIQNCFNILNNQQKDFFKIEVFVESIKNYLNYQNEKIDLESNIDFEGQLQYLTKKIFDLIQKKQNNINEKNKVKIKYLVKQDVNFIQTLKTAFNSHIPNCQQLIPPLVGIKELLEQKQKKTQNNIF